MVDQAGGDPGRAPLRVGRRGAAPLRVKDPQSAARFQMRCGASDAAKIPQAIYLQKDQIVARAQRQRCTLRQPRVQRERKLLFVAPDERDVRLGNDAELLEERTSRVVAFYLWVHAKPRFVGFGEISV